jgi:hypothetical protein
VLKIGMVFLAYLCWGGIARNPFHIQSI